MRQRGLLAILLAIAVCASTANAGTLQGTVRYTDRTYDQTGFTGTRLLPLRRAYVEIRRRDPQLTLIGEGATGADGSYSIPFANEGMAPVEIRVWTKTASNDPVCKVMVKGHPGRGPFAVYFVERGTPRSGGILRINTNVTTTQDVVVPLSESAPFNVFDVAIHGVEYLDSLDPALATESTLLRVYWPWPNQRTGYSATYDEVAISRERTFSDDSILHEVGHWAHAHFGRDDSRGLRHHVDELYDPTLALSEGWAHYFSSVVRARAGNTLWPDPRTYVQIDEVGHVASYLDLETRSVDGAVEPHAITQANELAVAAALWDLIDQPGPPTLGDPEAFDPIGNAGEQELWQALRGLKNIPADEKTTFDAWFRRWEMLGPPFGVGAATGTWGDGSGGKNFVVDGPFEDAQIRFYEDGPFNKGGVVLSESNDGIGTPEAGGPWGLGEADFPIELTLFGRDPQPKPDHKYDEDHFRVFGNPRPDGWSVQVTVRVSRIHEGSWQGKMDDAGDFELQAHGVTSDDLSSNEHQDLVTFAQTDPAPGDGNAWFPSFSIRVRRSPHENTVHFGYYRLDVQILP